MYRIRVKMKDKVTNEIKIKYFTAPNDDKMALEIAKDFFSSYTEAEILQHYEDDMSGTKPRYQVSLLEWMFNLIKEYEGDAGDGFIWIRGMDDETDFVVFSIK